MGRYPGLVSQPKGIEAQTLSLDFAASILEVCEAPPLPKTQGRSWKSLVTVGDPDWRTSWYDEYDSKNRFPYTPNVWALRTDEWKSIRSSHTDGSRNRQPAGLYNLKNDPGETANLIADPEYQSLVGRLSQELEERIAESDPDGEDRMPMDEGIKGELPDEKIR